MKKKLFRLVENNTFRVNSSYDTYETTIKITNPETDKEEDVDVIVEYDYSPPEYGERERGSGAPLRPDDSATVDIISVKDSDTGKEYDLPDWQIDELAQEILRDIPDDDYDDSHDGYDD